MYFSYHAKNYSNSCAHSVNYVCLNLDLYYSSIQIIFALLLSHNNDFLSKTVPCFKNSQLENLSLVAGFAVKSHTETLGLHIFVKGLGWFLS